MGNKIKDELVGNVFKNKVDLEFIVNKYLYTKGTAMYFEIEFLNTHTKKIVDYRNIKKGAIKDQYAPSKYGVAFIGSANSRAYKGKAYKKWDAMISRCYNKNNIEFDAYGGKGVTVCDRWLCFEYFLEDLTKIEGWNEEDFINGELQLDKDKKASQQNKVYSLETCCLLTQKENTKIKIEETQRKFEATHVDGIKYIGYSVNAFANIYGLSARTILRRLNGKTKKQDYKGWTFKYI